MEEKTKREEDKREVAFNLGSSQLILISKLLEKASNHYLEGEIQGWYTTLKNIKLQIVSRLSQEERQELKAKEKEICKNYHFHDKFRYSIIRNRIKTLTEEYEIRLKELLETKGYTLPLKQNKTSIFGKTTPDEE